MSEECKLTSALLKLKSAAMAIKTWEDCEKTIEQYDLIMLGEQADRVNAINTRELVHSLNTVFCISIDLDGLNRLIPAVCGSLGMAVEPLRYFEPDGGQQPLVYEITLFSDKNNHPAA